MAFSASSSREMSPLFVKTMRKPQSADTGLNLEDSLVPPTQRQSRVSIRDRAERYIQQAELSPDRWRVVEKDEHGQQSKRAKNQDRCTRTNCAISPAVFSTGEDEYLRHLGRQYYHALSLEPTVTRIVHRPSPPRPQFEPFTDFDNGPGVAVGESGEGVSVKPQRNMDMRHRSNGSLGSLSLLAHTEMAAATAFRMTSPPPMAISTSLLPMATPMAQRDSNGAVQSMERVRTLPEHGEKHWPMPSVDRVQSPTLSRAAMHTVAVYDDGPVRRSAPVTTKAISKVSARHRNDRRKTRSLYVDDKDNAKPVGSSKIDGLFTMEYEQMRLCGYVEDVEGAAKPMTPPATATGRTVRNVRSINQSDQYEYVVCSMQDLRELCHNTNRTKFHNSKDSALKQQMHHSSQQRLVNRSAQTNRSVIKDDRMDQEQVSHDPQPESNQFHKPWSTSDYVREQHRVDQQRLREIDQRELGVNGNYDGGWECQTWRRLYYVPQPEDVVKNRITRSEEILNEDRYQIDLHQLKERFIEQPQDQPSVRRVGRVWKAPMEKEYVFPQPRPPYRKYMEYVNDKENEWKPAMMFEPDIRYETEKLPMGRDQSGNGPAVKIDGERVVKMADENCGQHAPVQWPPGEQMSPGYSSVTLSDQPTMDEFDDQSIIFRNEPTPRHQSTITVDDRVRVNVLAKIMTFEGEGGKNSRGAHQTRPRHSSVHHDRTELPHSPTYRRAVHFANDGKQVNVRPAGPPLVTGHGKQATVTDYWRQSCAASDPSRTLITSSCEPANGRISKIMNQLADIANRPFMNGGHTQDRIQAKSWQQVLPSSAPAPYQRHNGSPSQRNGRVMHTSPPVPSKPAPQQRRR